MSGRSPGRLLGAALALGALALAVVSDGFVGADLGLFDFDWVAPAAQVTVDLVGGR